MTSDCKIEKDVKELQTCFGGYWRYPDVLDYYYLVNPYFPPRKLAQEFKDKFFDLLTQYPSGMRINCGLAAENFHVDDSKIVVGNGASELISSLMRTIKCKCGFIYPSFEEYPNRLPVKDRVPFCLNNDDFSYASSDIINFFSKKKNKIGALVIVNPDNPSGNMISRRDMSQLIAWTKNKGIRLVIDESFIDFADKPYTLVDRRVLSCNPHLVVIKSISKSYGVPGLRLGVLASGDEELIAWMKKDVSIWNINSFAEYYLQIAPRYVNDFNRAYAEFRRERSRFYGRLQKCKYLRVLPTNANYFLAEVLYPYSVERFVFEMFAAGRVLIKDCSRKKALEGKNYVRITIRNKKENNRFLNALKSLG